MTEGRLSPDEWDREWERQYEWIRDSGYNRDVAPGKADDDMREDYGPRPEGPARPFGPWLTQVPAAYDLSWHRADELPAELRGAEGQT